MSASIWIHLPSAPNVCALIRERLAGWLTGWVYRCRALLQQDLFLHRRAFSLYSLVHFISPWDRNCTGVLSFTCALDTAKPSHSAVETYFFYDDDEQHYSSITAALHILLQLHQQMLLRVRLTGSLILRMWCASSPLMPSIIESSDISTPLISYANIPTVSYPLLAR